MSSFNIVQPIQYKVTPTGIKFHNSTAKIKCILGPFGSGKSVACSEELLFNAMRQSPAPNGVRYSRYAVVRKYFPALKTTTRRTLMMAYPSNCGSIKETSPMEGVYRMTFKNAETGEEIKVQMELLLLAVDGSEESLEKLRSLDLTGAWCNEATEVPFSVITTLNERVGRYPAGEYGVAREPIILCDYNMPPYGHWLLRLSNLAKNMKGEEGMAGVDADFLNLVEFFVQPPAAFEVGESEDGTPIFEPNPNAENLAVLNAGGKSYYKDQISILAADGKYDYIRQMLCLIPGADNSGKPVYAKVYDYEAHATKRKAFNPNEPVIMGIDTSGLHPGAVVGQYTDDGFQVQYTVYGDGTGFKIFTDDMLVPLLNKYYPGSERIAVCDPANAKDSHTGTSPIDYLNSIGVTAVPASTNAIGTRIEASKSMLNKRTGGVTIAEDLEDLHAALGGGYKYRKISSNSGTDIYSETPVKDQFSHYADAFQYLSLYLQGEDTNREAGRNLMSMYSSILRSNQRYI